MGNGITGSILKMQSAGFSDDQVEAITGYIDSGAATKADIARLEGMIAGVAGEINTLKWGVGILIALNLSVAVKLFL